MYSIRISILLLFHQSAITWLVAEATLSSFWGAFFLKEKNRYYIEKRYSIYHTNQDMMVTIQFMIQYGLLIVTTVPRNYRLFCYRWEFSSVEGDHTASTLGQLKWQIIIRAFRVVKIELNYCTYMGSIYLWMRGWFGHFPIDSYSL